MSKLLPTGEIVEREAPQGLPLLRLAFRPLFLFGAAFSLFSLGLWGALLLGLAEPNLYGGGLWWHSHEMLFGFVAGIIAGFLLTAVQTWTGVPGIRGTALGLLVGLWLAARIALLFGDALPGWLVAAVDLLFLPVAAGVLARSVIRVRQWRNIVFVPVMLLMTLANACMHWSVLAGEPALQGLASRAMVLLVTLIMTIVAGRVVPMFTANGTGTERVPALPWLEKACLASMIATVLVGSAADSLPAGLVVAVFLVAAVAHSLRVLRWRPWVTLRTPLVWSLHLSYWAIPLGLALFAASRLPASGVAQSQAIHALTVGGMGLMILAMISRVSLGHTGRRLEVGGLMAAAFLALACAALVRVLGPAFALDYRAVILVSTGLWGLAYGCFIYRYLWVLSRPRVDGRPG